MKKFVPKKIKRTNNYLGGTSYLNKLLKQYSNTDENIQQNDSNLYDFTDAFNDAGVLSSSIEDYTPQSTFSSIEHITPSISDVNRLLTNKLARGNVDYDNAKLQLLQLEKYALTSLEEYWTILKNIDDLNRERNRCFKEQQLGLTPSNTTFHIPEIGTFLGADVDVLNTQSYFEALDRLGNSLNQYEDWFKNEGRNTDAVINNVYNLDKVGILEHFYQSLNNGIKTEDSHLLTWDNIKTMTGDVLRTGGNLISEIVRPLGLAFGLGVNKITGGRIGPNPGDYTREALRIANPETPSGHRLIRDSFRDRNDILRNGYPVKFEDALKDIESDELKWKDRYEIDLDFYKTGKWSPFWYQKYKIPYIGNISFKAYDPEDIDPEYKRAQEQEDHSLLEWRYQLPELGSTLGMFSPQIEAVAGDVALTLLGAKFAQKLPVWASRFVSKPGMTIAELDNALRASKLMSAANIASYAVKIGTIGTSTGMALFQTRRAREMETAMEAILAQGERILNNASHKGSDMDRVMFSLRNQMLQIFPNLNVDSFNEEDLIGSALAFDLKTGDQVFDQSKEESKKGINYLINANNSLAMMDFLQSIPFLNFGGSIFSKMSSNIYHGIADPIANRFAKRAGEVVAEKIAAPSIRGALDNIASRAAASVIKKSSSTLGAYGGKLLGKTISGVGRVAPLMAFEGATESFEEGVLELLLARYQRGEYDNYVDNELIFSVPLLFDDAKLTKLAILDYLGLDPSDPENGSLRIKKAMKAGLTSAMFLPAGMGGAKVAIRGGVNLAKGKPFSQTKADWVVADLIAHDYKTILDMDHANLFYEALDKGIPIENIIRSLDDYQNIAQRSGGEENWIDPNYIREDKRLANAVSTFYNSSDFKDAIKSYTNDQQKSIILNSAKRLADGQTVAMAALENLKELILIEQDRQNLVDELYNEDTSNERKLEIRENNPNLMRVLDAFNKLYEELVAKQNTYKSYLSNLYKNNYLVFSEHPIVQKEVERILRNDENKEQDDQNADENVRRENIAHGLYDKILVGQTLLDLMIDYDLHKNYVDQMLNYGDVSRNSYVVNYLRSMYPNLSSVLDHINSLNEEDKEQLLFSIIDYYKLLNQPLEQFLKNRLGAYTMYQKIQRLNALRNIYLQQLTSNEEINRASGLDLNTSNMKGLLAEMTDRINAVKSKLLNALQIKDESQFDFKKSFGLDDVVWFNNRDLEDKIYKNYIINSTTASVLGTISRVYRSAANGNINMPFLDRLYNIFYKDSQETQDEEDPLHILKALIEDHDKFLKLLQEQKSVLKQHEKFEINAHVQKTLKDIQKWLFDHDALLDEKRKRVVHRSIDEFELTSSQELDHPIEQSLNPIEESQETPENIQTAPIVEPPSLPDPGTPSRIDTINNEFDEIENSIDTDEENEDGDNNVTEDEETNNPIEDEEEPINSLEEEEESSNEPEEEEEEEPIEDEEEEEPIEDEESFNEPEEEEFPDVDFDWTKVEIINGDVFYDGQKLEEDEANTIIFEASLLDELDLGLSFQEIEDYVPGDTSSKSTISHSNVGNLVASTFFYDYEKQEVPIFDQSILNKPLGTPYELALKLIQKGWLANLYANNKVYYVVTSSRVLQEEGATEVIGDQDDALTISLIIEDEDKCYATFLRDLGKYKNKKDGKTYERDHAKELINWILLKNTDWHKLFGNNVVIPDTWEERSAAWKKRINTEVYYILGSNHLNFDNIPSNWTKDLIVKYTIEQGKKWFDENSKKKTEAIRSEIDSAYRKARRKYQRSGTPVITQKQAEQMIEELRDFRKLIIKAYFGKNRIENQDGTISYNWADMPKKAITTIIPSEVVLSNGRIVNEVEGLVHAVKNIAPNLSIGEIDELINDGKLKIGVGRGVAGGAGISINGGGAFSIFDPFDRSLLYPKSGLSGKLYWFVQGPGTNSKQVPIMLLEERFDTQQRILNGTTMTINTRGNGVKICLNPNTLENENKDGYLPSAAEVLFYMLCRKFDFGSTNNEDISNIIEFFIHSGEKTICKSKTPSFLASKQLWYTTQVVANTDAPTQGNKLYIAILDPNTGEYKLQYFTEEDLFGVQDVEKSAQNRATVILAIANQMHWNTDIKHISSTITTHEAHSNAISSFIRKLIVDLFKGQDIRSYLDSTISILGCPQLSFKVSDFFSYDGTKLEAKDVGVLSWMINLKKIYTDTADNIFMAPYVFARGIKLQNSAEGLANQLGQRVGKSDKIDPEIGLTVPVGDPLDVQFDLYNEEKRTNILSFFKDKYNKVLGRKLEENLWINFDKNKRQEILDRASVQKPVREVILLLPVNAEGDVVDNIYQRIKLLVELYNNNSESKLTLNEAITKKLLNNAKNILLFDETSNGKIVNPVFVIINEDGTLDVFSAQIKNVAKDINGYRVTGVFSKKGTKEPKNKLQARKWLCETLGIDEADVIVTNALLRTMHDEQVFAVTDVMTDAVVGGITGKIILSTYAEDGVEYHEAFHYVNLLLHNSAMRERIYNSFRKLNLEYRDASDKEVEEALADNFRDYVLRQNNLNQKNWFARLAHNFIEFINVVLLHKNEYLKIFRDIYKGKYKYSDLDLESVLEFHIAYESGVASKLGVADKDLKGFETIKTIKQFYETADSVVRNLMLQLNIKTADQLIQLSGSRFDQVNSIIDIMIQNLVDPVLIGRLKDLLNNPEILKRIIKLYFEDLGIKVKYDKKKEDRSNKTDIEVTDPSNVKADERDERQKKCEDEGELELGGKNLYDAFHFEMSKKDNASFRTKLFLKSIPKRHRTFVNGQEVIVEEKDMFGVPITWDYSEAWNNIINKLWSCTSFDKPSSGNTANQYDPHSMLGMIENLAKYDLFFQSIQDLIEGLDYSGPNGDIELRSQIYTSLNSHKQRIFFFLILSEKHIDYEEDDDMDSSYDDEDDVVDFSTNNGFTIADRERHWSTTGDYLIRVSRALPKRWSQALFSNGLVTFKDGRIVGNPEFVKKLRTILGLITQLLNKYYVSVTQLTTKSFSDKELYEILYEKVSIKSGEEEKVLPGIREQVLSLFRLMQIEADDLSLDIFLHSVLKKQGKLSYTDLINALYLVFSTSIETRGSIPELITTIASTANKKLGMRGNYTYELDKLYTNRPEGSDIYKLAIAYGDVHPSPQEFSVTSPEGKLLYPMNLNNFITSLLRTMNTDRKAFVSKFRTSPYARRSVLLLAINTDQYGDDEILQLELFIGLKDADRLLGADYFGITAREDLLSKLMITEGTVKQNGKWKRSLVFPTMADKKTWYTLYSDNIDLFHEILVTEPNLSLINDEIIQLYQQKAQEDDSFEHEPKPEDFGNNQEMYKFKYDTYKSHVLQWFNKLSDTDEDKALLMRLAAQRTVEKYKNSGLYYDEESGTLQIRLSDNALRIFSGYFLDELEAVESYYSKENIQRLVNDQKQAIENYDGTLDESGKRLKFNGNAGLFRYFYDVVLYEDIDDKNKKINLNQRLQSLYELQKLLEAGKIENHGYLDLTTNKDELDGFELIREEIKKLKQLYLNPFGATLELKNNINSWLVRKLYSELEKMTEPNLPLQLGEKKFGSLYLPSYIPSDLLKRYYVELLAFGMYYDEYKDAYQQSNKLMSAAFKSIIMNFTLNTMMSVIESEKIFTGDPAFYKWKNSGTTQVGINSISINGETVILDNPVYVEVNLLKDSHDDKIKRLGSALSPGGEIRLAYSQQELEFDPTLGSNNYTNLNIEDVYVQSTFLDIIKNRFKTEQIIVEFRVGDRKPYEKLIEYLINNNFLAKDVKKLYLDSKNYRNQIESLLNTKERSVNKNYEIGVQLAELQSQLNHAESKVLERIIDLLYSKQSLVDYAFGLFDDETKTKITNAYESKAHGYGDIDVTDALVIIRPWLYRKIRIGLGQWTFGENSDEEAYNILENSDEWMDSEKLQKAIARFEAYPLKMAYFLNEDLVVNDLVAPILNKMAIFPLFKFHRSTEVGRLLYERMNDLEKGCIDMISFKSAVKTGAKKNAYDPKGLSSLDERILNNSTSRVDYTTDEVSPMLGENNLPVTIQKLSLLRMLLNTHSHIDLERNIGTQMFKIAFSNIFDDAYYGTKKAGRSARLGKDIKQDIMSCINELTDIGVQEIQSDFCDENGNVDEQKVSNFILQQAIRNGLSSVASDILQNGVAESLAQRLVFEQSVSKRVNKAIVDINTPGGSAILQSSFGFSGKVLAAQQGDNYVGYNNGETLKWITDEGHMEVMLSMNFFKSVVPKEFLTDYHTMRQWLIDHDIIKGLKSKQYWNLSEADGSLILLLDTKISDLDFSVKLSVILEKNNISTLGDIIENKTKLQYKLLGKKLFNELEEILLSVNLTWDTKRPEIEPVYSKPNPFGIGYRIPTQGMSSMFGFIVADVLPSTAGDLIIVPPEFTKQTGSDFDVDKLYIATFSYKNGVYEKYVDNEQHTKGMLTNRLLEDYLDIISDRRNFTLSRGSIDTITEKLKDNLVDKELSDVVEGYLEGGVATTPSFLALRKLEFGTGKDGIAPFALSIANLGLTQFVHLTMDYGQEGVDYNLGSLDSIYGQDGEYISDWLSAMVNAHVDVAKDPYIFKINVNQFTYNHTAFLLRAGKGLSTFTFLSQPALKRYASAVNNNGGLYGDNFDGSVKEQEMSWNIKNEQWKTVVKFYINILKKILKNEDIELSKEVLSNIKQTIAFFEYKSLTPYERLQKGYDKEYEKTLINPFDHSKIFDVDEGKLSLTNHKLIFDSNGNILYLHVDKIIQTVLFLLNSLYAFNRLDSYAKALSDLVHCSLIDTKKFGNNIIEQLEFISRLNRFMYSSTLFTINDPLFLYSVPKRSVTQSGNNTYYSWKKHDISEAALHRYFYQTYLAHKLFKATEYTRKILQSQLLTATSVFYDVFENVCLDLYGSSEYNHLDFSKDYTKMSAEEAAKSGVNYKTHKSTVNSQKLLNFSKSIDDIMRYNIMYTRSMDAEQNDKEVDFTCGGNIDEIMSKFQTLLYGNDKTKSIFKRWNELKATLTTNPDLEFEDGYDQLVLNGQIINSVLLYISGAESTKRGQPGRFILSQGSTFTDDLHKAILIADFEILLSSPIADIRNLAKDMVWYAYFNSYDRSFRDAFFDIVPLLYRKNYDRAIKKVIRMNLYAKSNGFLRSAITRIPYIVNSETADYNVFKQQSLLSIIDVLSRNYWFDDDIVKTHVVRSQSLSFFNSSNELRKVVYTTPIYIKNGYVPSSISTMDQVGIASPTYLKIRTSDQVVLYRKAGSITRGEQTYSVYLPIDKLGISIEGRRQFEYFANYGDRSIFDENKLPNSLLESNTRKRVEQLVEKANEKVRVSILKSGNNTEEGISIAEDQEFVLSWNNPTVPINYVGNEEFVIEVGKPKTVGSEVSITGAKVKVVKDGRNLEHVAQFNADFVINVYNLVLVNESNLDEASKDKRIGLDISNIEAAVKHVLLLIQSLDRPVNLHFTTSYDNSIPLVQPSKEMLQWWRNRMLSEYAEQYDGENVTDEQIEQMFELDKKQQAFVKSNAQQQALVEAMIKVFELLINSGKVNSVSVVYQDNRSKGIFKSKTKFVHAVLFANKEFSSDDVFHSAESTLYIGSDITQTKRFLRLLNALKFTRERMVEAIDAESENEDSPIDVLVAEESNIISTSLQNQTEPTITSNSLSTSSETETKSTVNQTASSINLKSLLELADDEDC